MKNKIMILLLCSFLLAGCGEDELIEVSSYENISDTTKDGADSESMSGNEKADNNDKEAETDYEFRPFVVYVCGEVNNPGVYKLSEGSRVIDAIMAAGGYTERACDVYLNLASLVNDGERVYVPSVEEIENGDTFLAQGTNSGTILGEGGLAGGAGQQPNGLININTATKEELMTLPGIGESKAEKIISYRESNGKFSSPEDIMNISGIKEGLYNKIKDKICAR